jgi:hypothetical protein
MDIDGESAFIKQVDSRDSSSTVKHSTDSTTRASTDSLGEKPLEELFPRKAVFVDFEGQNLYAELVLKERGLFLIGRRELGSSSDGRFRCRSNGKLLANPAEIKSWSDYTVDTMCTIFLNGGYGQVNRDLIGTIDQIKIKHPEPYSTQTVVFRFLGPSDYVLFLQARDNNLGQNAFGTDEFAEALEASNSPGKTSMAGDDLAIEQEFWKSVEDSDDVDVYMAYLESYPDGQFAPLARLNIKRLEKSPEKSPAIELEFWKTIKNSDDPEMFQVYLDEYPNGKFAPLAKIKIKKLGGTLTNGNSPAKNLSSLLGTYKGYYAQSTARREMFIDFFRDTKGNIVGRQRQPHYSWEEHLTEIRPISTKEWTPARLPASRCDLKRHCVKASWANSQNKGTYWFQFTLDYVAFEGLWGTPGDPLAKMSGKKIATQ